MVIVIVIVIDTSRSWVSTRVLLDAKMSLTLTLSHRHLREIDLLIGRSWWAGCNMSNGTESGGKRYTGPAYITKACFKVAGDITTAVNKGRRARPMSGLLL